MATLREKTEDVRRGHILEAAAQVFAERGYNRATIKDVARAAGVSDGSIYNVEISRRAVARMPHVLGLTVSLAIVASALGCSTTPRTAPPSLKPVDASADGLTALISQECLAQSDTSWVREESKRRRDACGAYDNGDCALRADGSVSWDVPTTVHSNVVVTMSWLRDVSGKGPPNNPLDCSIAIPDALGAYVPQVIENLRSSGRAVYGPVERDSITSPPITSAHPAPRIDVYHWASADAYRKLVEARRAARGETTPMTPNDPSLLAYQAMASHPWEIRYIAH